MTFKLEKTYVSFSLSLQSFFTAAIKHHQTVCGVLLTTTTTAFTTGDPNVKMNVLLQQLLRSNQTSSVSHHRRRYGRQYSTTTIKSGIHLSELSIHLSEISKLKEKEWLKIMNEKMIGKKLNLYKQN